MEKHWKEIIMALLAVVISVGFFVLCWRFIGVNAESQTAGMLFGTLCTAFGTVVGYFFGSSKGSSDKNELMKK